MAELFEESSRFDGLDYRRRSDRLYPSRIRKFARRMYGTLDIVSHEGTTRFSCNSKGMRGKLTHTMESAESNKMEASIAPIYKVWRLLLKGESICSHSPS